LSNLVDVVLPDQDGALRVNALHQQTPKQLFALLSPSAELSRFYGQQVRPPSALFEHSFNLKLLLSSNFIHRYIKHIHPDLSESIFFMALTSADCSYVSSLQTSHQEEEWRISAQIAEQRSQQHAWGEPLPVGEGTSKANMLLALELELEYHISNAKTNVDSMDEDEDDSVSVSSSHLSKS
jgi:hypothetical protein